LAGKQPSVTRKILQWGCLVPTALVLLSVAWWGVGNYLVVRRAERARSALRVGMPAADAMKVASDWNSLFAESQPDARGNRASFLVVRDKEGGFRLLRPEPSRRVAPEELGDMIKKDGRTWTTDFAYSGIPQHEFSVTFSPQGLLQRVSALRLRD